MSSNVPPHPATGDAHARLARAEATIGDLRAANSALEADCRRLTESEGRLRAVLDSATEFAIITTDPDGLVTGWSSGAERVLGWSATEMLGRSVDAIYTPQDQAGGVPAWERAGAGREGSIPEERWHCRHDGSTFWGSGQLTALAGASPGFVKVMRDRTAERAAAEALETSERRFRGFAEHSADTLWIATADGARLEYLSPAFERMFGEGRERVMADLDHWRALVHPDDRARAETFMRRTLEGETVIGHYRAVRPDDGAVVHMRDTGFRIRDERGRIAHVAGVVQDITDIHEVGAALETEKERFRTLAEGIPQLVWRAFPAAIWTAASPQWCTHTGQSESESLGRGWLEAVHPDDRAATERAWAAAPAQELLEVEHRIRGARGDWRWHQTRALQVRDAGGAVVEWLGTTTDIEDQKRLLAQKDVLLAELQHRTRNLLGVVRSLARHSFEPSPARDMLEARLAAIGRVQGFLSRAPGWSVSLREVLEAELRAVGAEADPRVRLHGPEVALAGEQAQPVALAVHELATNALKHGALSRPGAALAVSWHLRDAALRLEWRESGVALPPGAAPARVGYGRELIERALPFQLGAETRLEFTPGEVRCRIVLPLPPTEHSDDITAPARPALARPPSPAGGG